mmetsp:Transcript_1730/g.3827  ORF Transcript_1730/g.3827 Transcript_1730/m.3827 type:complete len:254 (+) Transcript_1730:1648-2409(+)
MVVDLDNIGVVELLHEFDFLVDKLNILHHGFANVLHGPHQTCRAVSSLGDGAEGSGAQLLLFDFIQVLDLESLHGLLELTAGLADLCHPAGWSSSFDLHAVLLVFALSCDLQDCSELALVWINQDLNVGVLGEGVGLGILGGLGASWWRSSLAATLGAALACGGATVQGGHERRHDGLCGLRRLAEFLGFLIRGESLNMGRPSGLAISQLDPVPLVVARTGDLDHFSSLSLVWALAHNDIHSFRHIENRHCAS